MGRNNTDFFSGGGYHFAPKSARKDIERKGLVPGPEPASEDDAPSGVYVYDSKQDAEHVGKGGYHGHDIYRVHIPINDLNVDDFLTSGNASYSEAPVPATKLTRIGHVTDSGDMHFSHTEENCNG